MTADEFHRAVTKDGFRPFRLLLADGQEVHVLGDNEYGLDQGTMILGADLRYIDAADVERVEPLPYRVIEEDRRDIERARKALAEIKRRSLVPWDELKKLLGLEGGSDA